MQRTCTPSTHEFQSISVDAAALELLALNMEEKQPTLMMYMGGLCGNELLKKGPTKTQPNFFTCQLVLHTTFGRHLKQLRILVSRERKRQEVVDEYHEILILGTLTVHPDMYLSEVMQCTLSYWNLSFQLNYFLCVQEAWLHQGKENPAQCITEI